MSFRFQIRPIYIIITKVEDRFNVTLSSHFVQRVIAKFKETGSVERKERKKFKDRHT